VLAFVEDLVRAHARPEEGQEISPTEFPRTRVIGSGPASGTRYPEGAQAYAKLTDEHPESYFFEVYPCHSVLN